jgi:hypothetical protein
MSYNLDQVYTVQRVDRDTPCSLHPGDNFTIKEVIPERIIPERIIPKKYKIETELGDCGMSLTGAEIAKFEGLGGGGNRRSKRKRCRSKRKKRSKRRSKRSKK